MDRFQRELNQLTLGSDIVENDNSNVVTSRWRPAVDIKEETDRFVIHADLPGVDPKDIDITMEGGMLTIKGERQSESREETDGYKRVERVAGTFYRRISLPDTADADRIGAKGKNGVLEVIIPKQEKVQPRKITVNN
ncbi:MAG: Hsp20/alpha crystallin family protein [Gammaproteobacteria bacterium]